MAIEFRCEKCEKKLKVKDELAGKKIKCPECGAAIAIPAAKSSGKQKLNPELGSTESIINLNLKKFKNKDIDLDEDEDFNIDELEGAVVARKKREQQVLSGPPKEPLEPMDWVFALLFGGFCCIYPIVLLVQGKRSRGMKTLMLSVAMNLFWMTVQGLTFFAISMGQR